MNIGVFAYNFKHQKTQEGIQNLCLAGFKPSVIFAADKVKLNFYRSKIRITPKDVFLHHPSKLASYYGIDYVVTKHNSNETDRIVKEKQLDVGIILGARILKPIAFRSFKIGVINMHPGLLPENRGLDTVKWAINDNLPQGVTTHLIDSKIDRGLMIHKKQINVYQDDSLLDIFIRLQNLEQNMMIDALRTLQTTSTALMPLPIGKYHSSIPEHLEVNLIKKFETYKKEYSNARDST